MSVVVVKGSVQAPGLRPDKEEYKIGEIIKGLVTDEEARLVKIGVAAFTKLEEVVEEGLNGLKTVEAAEKAKADAEVDSEDPEKLKIELKDDDLIE
jgi:hypothetical protein